MKCHNNTLQLLWKMFQVLIWCIHISCVVFFSYNKLSEFVMRIVCYCRNLVIFKHLLLHLSTIHKNSKWRKTSFDRKKTLRLRLRKVVEEKAIFCLPLICIVFAIFSGKKVLRLLNSSIFPSLVCRQNNLIMMC